MDGGPFTTPSRQKPGQAIEPPAGIGFLVLVHLVRGHLEVGPFG